MANLKELRNKIGVVQSTRKVTAAMKLVAGVKLRKSEHLAGVSREYAQELDKLVSEMRARCVDDENPFFYGRSQEKVELVVVFSSDRGLCGNFNYMINKKVQQILADAANDNKQVFLLCVGSKIFDLYKHKMRDCDRIELVENFYKEDAMFDNSKTLASRVIDAFQSGAVDKVSVVYTRYHSAMRRSVEQHNLIPVSVQQVSQDRTETVFEPDFETVLQNVLPYNIGVQIYQAALDSLASEHSSRMTSMDSATRNADGLLSELTVKYNRMRQYGITQELVEVIAGAKAIEE